jgi:hypothetical protein
MIKNKALKVEVDFCNVTVVGPQSTRVVSAATDDAMYDLNPDSYETYSDKSTGETVPELRILQ